MSPADLGNLVHELFEYEMEKGTYFDPEIIPIDVEHLTISVVI